MKTLAEFDKEVAEKRAQLEAEHALVATLPAIDGIAPSYVHMGRNHDPIVNYKVESLADARHIVCAYTLVPYDDVRAGGTRYIGPDAKTKPRAGETVDVLHSNVTAPYLDLSTIVGEYGSDTTKLVFWAKVGDRTIQVTCGPDYGRSRGDWPWRWRMRVSTQEVAGVIVSATFTTPDTKALPHDWSVKYGTGSNKSGHIIVGWNTLERFLDLCDITVAELAQERKQSDERARQYYLTHQRKPAEVVAHCRLVLDTLNRADIKTALGVETWTLDSLRAIDYKKITKIVGELAPDVMSAGLHDFSNTVYYLGTGSDDYDSHVPYREDVRETFRKLCAGEPTE